MAWIFLIGALLASLLALPALAQERPPLTPTRDVSVTYRTTGPGPGAGPGAAVAKSSITGHRCCDSIIAIAVAETSSDVARPSAVRISRLRPRHPRRRSPTPAPAGGDHTSRRDRCDTRANSE